MPTLKYEDNELVFEFASSQYAKAGTRRYQYFLQGFDRDWSSTDQVSSKEYTNLPEGEYQFRGVRAEDPNGVRAREAVFGCILAPLVSHLVGIWFVGRLVGDCCNSQL